MLNSEIGPKPPVDDEYIALALPKGWKIGERNWKFKPLFCPYIVFGRMHAIFAVSHAPTKIEIVCPSRATDHYHDDKVNNPMIQ